MQSKSTRSAKHFPLPTIVELTKALIQRYAQVVAELGLKQIEVCDKRERGLRAIIYASGRVVFHARYFWLKRSCHKKLGEFGALTIEQARAKNRERATKLSASTQANYLSLVRTLFQLAVDLGFIEANPTRTLKAPRKANRTTLVMTMAQVKSLVTGSLQHSNRQQGLFIALLALTAMRQGELLACTRKNINLQNKVIRLSTSKNGRAGVIHLSDKACALLQEQMNSHTQELIFPALRGGQGAMCRPARAFRELCQQAGITGFTLHSLRHAWASHVGHHFSNVVAQQQPPRQKVIADRDRGGSSGDQKSTRQQKGQPRGLA